LQPELPGSHQEGGAEKSIPARRTAKTLDRGAVLRLAGKVPKTMEELRTKTEHKPANDPLGVSQTAAQKIVNRL
jgi:hypothetical protein